MISPDTFVASIAIFLGVGSLAVAGAGPRLIRWSGMAQRIEQSGGRIAFVVIYGALGVFLIGVGISILN